MLHQPESTTAESISTTDNLASLKQKLNQLSIEIEKSADDHRTESLELLVKCEQVLTSPQNMNDDLDTLINKLLQEVDDNGNTLLHLVARSENIDFLKTILATGPGKQKLATENGFNDTPLHHAALKGSAAAVKIIIEIDEAPQLLDKANKFGYTPLHYAADRRETDTLREILKTDEGKKLLDKQDHNGNTPLLIAIRRGNTDAVKDLLELSTYKQLTIKNRREMSALEVAQNEDIPKICMLVERRLESLQKGNASSLPFFSPPPSSANERPEEANSSSSRDHKSHKRCSIM